MASKGVGAEIKRVIREKEAGLRSGQSAVLAILKALQRDVLASLGRAAISSWDEMHLGQVLDAVELQINGFTTRMKSQVGGMVEEGWGLGVEMVDAPLAATSVDVGGFYISTSSLEVLKDFSFTKVKGLSSSAMDKIKTELTLGVLGQKTPQEVATAIGLNLKGRSIFTSIAARAEVIAKNEMGKAFSKATQLRMEEAAKHVPGMEKQWVHAGHPKQPRESHLWADGTHVAVNKKFNVGGVKMMFPRDPAAPLGETINCGCDHVPYHPDWEDDNFTRRTL